MHQTETHTDTHTQTQLTAITLCACALRVNDVIYDFIRTHLRSVPGYLYSTIVFITGTIPYLLDIFITDYDPYYFTPMKIYAHAALIYFVVLIQFHLVYYY